MVAILVIHCRPTELETGQNGANGTDAAKSADLKPCRTYNACLQALETLFFRLQAGSGTGNDLVAEALHYPAFPCCLAVMANDCKTVALQQVAFDSLYFYLPCFDASFLPDPAASIAMNSKNKSLISTQELGIEFIATAFSRKALQEKRKEIELLITGYNLGVNHIKMHPQSEWKQVLMEIGVPENLTALPTYRKATRPSAEAIEKATQWLKANHRIPQTYSESNLIDTTYIHTVSTTIQ